MLPGSNLFISPEDLTTPADSTGTNRISCRRLADHESASIPLRGWNIVRRFLIGIAGA